KQTSPIYCMLHLLLLIEDVLPTVHVFCQQTPLTQTLFFFASGNSTRIQQTIPLPLSVRMKMAEHFPRIGFIGAGRMATAMVQALLRSKMTPAERVVASDVVEEARDVLADLTQIKVYAENQPVVDKSEII